MDQKPTYEELEKSVEQLKADLSHKEHELDELKRFIDRSQDVIYRYDIDNELFVLFNKAAYNFFGVKDGKDITSKTTLLSIDAEDRDKVRKAARDSLSPDRDGGEVEYRYQHIDGSCLWMHDRWVVMRDESGKPLFIEGIVRDITEHKRAEEALRESEERFRVVFENSPMGIAIVDMNYEILRANKAYCDMLGYGEEEIIKESSHDLTHPDDIELTRYFQKRLESGDTAYFQLEKRFIGKNSDIVHGLLVASLMRDTSGTPIYMLEQILDITDLKNTQEVLSKKNAELEAIFNSIPDALAFSDLNRLITRVNPGFTRLFGYEIDEIFKGRTSLFYKSKADFEKQGKIRYRLDAEVRTDPYEIEYRRKSGEVFLSETIGTVVKNEMEEAIGFIALIRDITEIKKTEALLKKSQEQMRNLSRHLQSVREEERMSIARDIHDELGQALTALKMDLSMLSKKYPMEAQTFAAKIRDMIALINDQIKTTKALVSRLRPGILDDFGLFAAIEWQIEEFTNRTKIVCHVSKDDRADQLILDREIATSVFRIFQETLTNVARHAGASEVHIDIKQDKDLLILTTRDNGRGIKESRLTHPDSFGILGMHERAREFNGDLSVKGIEGEGTTVEVKVPVK